MNKELDDFRVEHKEALDELFTEVLGLLSVEGLMTLERVMHDGTKIKACASSDTFRREGRVRAHLEAARQQVAEMGDPRTTDFLPVLLITLGLLWLWRYDKD